jgi:hypothetical protein
MGISRPSVSRLLQYAKEQGYVNIQIIDPVENMEELETAAGPKIWDAGSSRRLFDAE